MNPISFSWAPQCPQCPETSRERRGLRSGRLQGLPHAHSPQHPRWPALVSLLRREAPHASAHPSSGGPESATETAGGQPGPPRDPRETLQLGDQPRSGCGGWTPTWPPWVQGCRGLFWSLVWGLRPRVLAPWVKGAAPTPTAPPTGPSKVWSREPRPDFAPLFPSRICQGPGEEARVRVQQSGHRTGGLVSGWVWVLPLLLKTPQNPQHSRDGRIPLAKLSPTP